MSYNPNFYNNFQPHTFQRPNFVPPPPMPPAYYIPPSAPSQISDQDFIKQFERPSTSPLIKQVISNPTLSINAVKQKLRNLVLILNDVKEKEIFLKENCSTISEDEWTDTLAEIEKSKKEISNAISDINDSYLDSLRKLLAKRSAKRLRLKRVKQEKKREREDRIIELKERSRKIDENLQKIKDDINKAKQEEEAKLQADIVLKETLRKKHDAKKCLTKMDALLKLYKARQNTAKGRGQNVSERDAEVFSNNIEKLKSLWQQKLQLYEKEETDLRATLEQNGGALDLASQKDARVLDNLSKWRDFLFGGIEPQRDFQGDVEQFIAIRSQWDQYIHPDGSSLPVGWVIPNNLLDTYTQEEYD